MCAEISRLAESVAEGLKKRSLAGLNVTLKVRYENFETVTRSKTLQVRTNLATQVEEVGLELLAKTEAGDRAVRLLGLGMAKLGPEEVSIPRQLELNSEA